MGTSFLFFFFFFWSLCLLGPHPRHMEVPKLGVESELQPLVCTTAAATPDPSRVCDLHHISWHPWILNPLSEARDRTRVLVCTSWCVTTEPQWELPYFFFKFTFNEWNSDKKRPFVEGTGLPVFSSGHRIPAK